MTVQEYPGTPGSTRCTSLLCQILLLLTLTSVAAPSGSMAATAPDSIQCTVRPYYRHRPDGTPGREVAITVYGAPVSGMTDIELRCGTVVDVQHANVAGTPTTPITVLLPSGLGVRTDTSVTVTVRQPAWSVKNVVRVPAMRHWTVYVYPHSHVDIGYSNTHANVEFIHKRNVERGSILARATASYPPGSRYVWNTEVMWPFERSFSSASAADRTTLLDGVRSGALALDASYVHVLTTASGDEEMFQNLRPRAEIARLTGAPMDTYVQVDVPGMAWGLVPVLAHEGVKYVMMMPNGTRGNDSLVTPLRQRPMWWVGPDGTSRVLFLNAGTYGAGMTKGGATGRPWFGQRDRDKIPLEIRTQHPRDRFLDEHLFRELPRLEAEHHPYDLFVVTWAMWDNALLDADLPDAVRSWNEDYAYPHLEIASAHTIMSAFEKAYGPSFPVVHGDFTEYWTDGFGTVARETRVARNARDRLIQAETLWPMLRPGKPAPRAEFDEAWRNVVMTSEHTFTYENPTEPYFQDAIWRMKQRYFQEVDDRSHALMDDALAPATDKSNGALGPGEGPSQGGIAVFNTHSWPHGGLITLPPAESQRGDRVIDEKGLQLLSQRLSTGELAVMCPEVPAFGSRHFRVVAGTCSLQTTSTWSTRRLDNGILQVDLDPATGAVGHIRERGSDRDLVDAGINGGLNTFIWQPGKGLGAAATDTVIGIRLCESGPLLGEVEVTARAPGCRSVVRRVRLVTGSSAVGFINTVDKLPLLPKDGVHFAFPFRIPGGRARVEIPWGMMELQRDQWPAANRAWMALQHVADISNDAFGVTWCSPDAPLIEYGAITANNTANWDGTGDIWPSAYAGPTVLYSWVMNNHWFTNTPLTQEGPVTFRYALRPHGPYDAARAYRFGREEAQPLIALATSRDPQTRPLVTVDNDRVVVTILKADADGKGMIVRLRSLSDAQEQVRFTWPCKTPATVRVCERGEEPGTTDASASVRVPMHGIVTLAVRW